MKRFLVFIKRKPSYSGEFLQGHENFLKSLREKDVLNEAGGFEDQTGGAYVIQDKSLSEAKAIVANDPMNNEQDTVYTIKEWKFQ